MAGAGLRVFRMSRHGVRGQPSIGEGGVSEKGWEGGLGVGESSNRYHCPRGFFSLCIVR